MKTVYTWPESRFSRMLAAMLMIAVFVTLAASAAAAQTYALSVSTNSNHSSAIALQGATISGNVYVFTSSGANPQNYDPSGIKTVCFWLDNPSRVGTARHCESSMPYDFILSVSNSTTSPAEPWNTTQVANGTHTITQVVTKSAGGSEVDTATFTITASAALQSVSVNPSTVTGGKGSTGTVTLTKAAPSGGLSVSLSSNNAAAQVGASVMVPVNASSATFSIATSAVGVSTTVTISAIYKGVTKTARLTVGVSAGPTAPMATFTANPTTIPLGQTSTLSWTTTNATSVSINNGIGTVPTIGSFNVDPAVNTTYTLTATGPGGTVNASITVTVGTATVQRYEYVMQDQTLFVYDLDTFQLVKQVSIPQVQGTRGIGAVPGTHMLYISYGQSGPNTTSIPGSLLAYDLLTDTVEWTTSYSFGIDSFDITLDGKTIYMPVGDATSSGVWNIIDAATGDAIGNINTGWAGAHNTVVSLDGNYVFLGPRGSPELVLANTSTPANGVPPNSVVRNIGPLEGNVTPFTINGKHTLAFTTALGYSGFQVSNTTTGAVLYTVPVSGFSIPPNEPDDTPDHGISLSPDEKEIYLIDTANAYVHVFDVSGVSATPPVEPTQIADIPLTNNFTGLQSPCVYSCTREGWIRHTRDGQYVIVGDSGDVIETSTRQIVGTLPALYDTRVYVEIDWQNGLPISTTTREGKGYVTQ